MRRLLALLTTAALIAALASTALAVTGEWGNYKDKFDEPSYHGSNGSIWWEKPWLEIGESDGPERGRVHVSPEGECAGSSCLHIENELLDVSVGAKRQADLSGFADAELCFEMFVHVDELLGITDAVLSVQVTDGSQWKTIESFDLAVNQGYAHPIIDVTEWISKDFAVRFLVNGILGGEVFIDTVELKGLLKPATTSTTSTTSSSSSTSTSSSSSSTTTSTQPTTTTSRPSSTSSSSTSTTVRAATTTTTSQLATTTTVQSTTSSEAAAAPLPGGPPPGSGIRLATSGIQSNYDSGMFGEMSMDKPRVLGVDLEADYTMAAEVIESSWIWILALALLITTAIVSGLDRRRVPVPGT